MLGVNASARFPIRASAPAISAGRPPPPDGAEEVAGEGDLEKCGDNNPPALQNNSFGGQHSRWGLGGTIRAGGPESTELSRP